MKKKSPKLFSANSLLPNFFQKKSKFFPPNVRPEFQRLATNSRPAFWLFAALLALDQISKFLIFSPNFPPEILEFFAIPRVRNHGAARSLPVPARATTAVFLTVAALFLAQFFSAKNPRPRAAIAIFLAGATGNFLDRAIFSAVRDFLRLGDRFPIFNFADIFLTFGLARILRAEFFPWKKSAKK